MEGIQGARSTNWKSLLGLNWKTSGRETRNPASAARFATSLMARPFDEGMNSSTSSPTRGVNRVIERRWSIIAGSDAHIITGVRGAGYGVRDTGLGIRDAGYGRTGLRHPAFELVEEVEEEGDVEGVLVGGDVGDGAFAVGGEFPG